MIDAMTATRLTVNAAFLKEIKDDNLHLKKLWDKVVPMVSHPDVATNHWPELIELLAELCDQLALHFSLEEAYGYFDEAVDIAPRLSLAAESLRSQHCKIFALVRDLADEISEVDYETPENCQRFIDKFNVFRAEFESHEEAELRLILDSLEDDIGGGD